MKGFAGKLLRVDLTEGKWKSEPLDEDAARKFMGSKGYAAYILFRELKKGVEPLSPDNKVVIMTGPLTGTQGPMPNRFSVCTRSPLTGAWVDSHCGGFWGPELKFAGWDGIIIEGKAKGPVHLKVRDGTVELEDAKGLWGKGTFETVRALDLNEHQLRKMRVLSIGPAGERMAHIACVIADGRAAGRGGTGAVLGSKNLKAVSVIGTGKVEVADEGKFSPMAKEARAKLSASKGLKDRTLDGTAANIRPVNNSGGLPTRNFQSGKFERMDEIAGDSFAKHLWNGSRNLSPCWGCVSPCAHYALLERYGGVRDDGPEYETVALIGSNLGISDREVIAYADRLLDDAGLDTISFGNTLGFIIECFEKGLVGKDDTNGLELKFGDSELLIKAIGLAQSREGRLGELLADGSMRAARSIGKGSGDFAMHVKGLEIPAYDPRASPGQALSYAVSDRGACHLRPFMYASEHFGNPPRLDATTTEGRGKEVKSGQERSAIADALGICKFYAYGLSLVKDVIPLVVAATGFDYSVEEFLLVGERINNLTRAFNCREGFDIKDDSLPGRVKVPLKDGKRAGMPMDIESMRAEYYRECGWDARGVPTEEKLRNLGLDFAFK